MNTQAMNTQAMNRQAIGLGFCGWLFFFKLCSRNIYDDC